MIVERADMEVYASKERPGSYIPAVSPSLERDLITKARPHQKSILGIPNASRARGEGGVSKSTARIGIQLAYFAD